jgi:predicted MPP superfamily phosphohydrolase
MKKNTETFGRDDAEMNKQDDAAGQSLSQGSHIASLPRRTLISRRRKKYVFITLGSLLLIVLLLGLWAFVVEPNRLTVNEVTINLPNWPPGFERLRIVLISDLHVGSPYIDVAKLQRIVETTNAIQPDLILLAGDFMVTSGGQQIIEPEIIADNLKSLRSRFGVFAVLGNHDWWYGGERVRAALNAVGIRVLENDVARIEQQGKTLWVAGLADAWTRKPDIAGTLQKVTDDGPIIALTHNPDLFPIIPQRVALTLAGHTHGGQVNIPFIGRPQVPSQYGERYAIGHIEEGNRHLFVTPGVGTSILAVRFRVPPEISVLTITAQPSR